MPPAPLNWVTGRPRSRDDRSFDPSVPTPAASLRLGARLGVTAAVPRGPGMSALEEVGAPQAASAT